ncbi:hypothetical protein WJX72_003558 [[Myrmecia] bisecta]|uniref:Embryonic stem cell-specific 5-hydroxymethylcytosine-binding protein n=1 Tax=[Myrmecia] bisecta TaxID=41462 RepID=A0AAW1Q6E5_9CHLO
MCGRSRATLSPQQVTAAAGVPLERWRNSEQYQPSYNVSPGFSTPVVRQSSAGKPELQTMKWGLVPSYTKAGEKPDFFRMFNARSESVAEKGVFKRLLSRHRCVVLLNGFYEWAKEGKHKQPYYIHMGTGEGDVIRMAGLFDCWDNGPEGPMYTYTILTTDSSKRLQWLHDRMPVILPDEAAAEQWLAGEALDHKELSRIAEPYNGDDLRWHKVSPAMSNMRYQGADCAKELKRESVASFFKPVAGKAKATAEAAVQETSGRSSQAGREYSQAGKAQPIT